MRQDFNDLFYVHQANANMELRSQIQGYLEYFLGKAFGDLEYFYPIHEYTNRKDDAPDFAELLRLKLFDLSSFNEFKYSLDIFDCVTFVETILSLIKINDFGVFPKHINKITRASEFQNIFLNNLLAIRYKNASPTFLHRNHFMSADWLPNNIDLITNITNNLGFKPLDAVTMNNKRNWLKKHKVMQYLQSKINENNKIFEEYLDLYAQDFKNIEVVTKYLPLEDVLKNYKSLSDNIPEVSIVCIVRPNWDLRDTIGTCLNVSHLGICIKDAGNASALKFYHATINSPKKVVVTDLHAYLTKCLEIPSIKGISVHKLNLEKNM